MIGMSKPIKKPLAVRTPFFDNETITSWLARAAMNQGCSLNTFRSFYWKQYTLNKVLDADIGFNSINEQIHQDMAVLSSTTKDRFNNQDLSYFKKLSSNNPLLLLPYSQNAKYGHNYCPLCFTDDKTPYLRLDWRMSYYIFCDTHKTALVTSCPHCGEPYKPQLLNFPHRQINFCHSCSEDISIGHDLLLANNEEMSFQNKLIAIKKAGEVDVFGCKTSFRQWLDYITYLISLTVFLGSSQKNLLGGNTLTGFNKFGIDSNELSKVLNSAIRDGQSVPRFQFLPSKQRLYVLLLANKLSEKSLDEWLELSNKHTISRKLFKLNSYTKIPEVFLPVYEQVYGWEKIQKDSKSNTFTYKIYVSPFKPKSIEECKAKWEALLLLIAQQSSGVTNE